MGTYQKPSQGPEPSNTKHRPISLPRVHTADEATRPLGQGTLQAEDMNFDIMVDMRRAHQTKQAATGVRTKKSKPSDGSPRGRIISEFHQALKEAQQNRGVTTGLDRGVRWREPAPGGRDGVLDGASAPTLAAGNAANAAVTAADNAKKVSMLPLSVLVTSAYLSSRR